MAFELWILGGLLIVGVAYITVDILYERRQIERYLRIGGARIVGFRWKPFLGWMGADRKSKHYEVTFLEHSGLLMQAIFTYTAGVGVTKTSDRILSPQKDAQQVAGGKRRQRH
jgi:hypothetical protein